LSTRASAAVLIAGLLMLAACTRTPATPRPTAPAYPVPLVIEEAGVKLEPVGAADRALTSQDAAIAAAIKAAGGLGDPNKPFSAQLVRFTDLDRGPDGGPLVIEERLVWLIRFTGTPQPVYGGLDPRTGLAVAKLIPPDEIATELNVVIDATTGEYLEAFSYR
jgi:hypothetical protein